MLVRKIIFTLLFSLLLAGQALGHTVGYEVNGEVLFEVELPDGWTTTLDGAKLYLSPATDLAWVGIWKVDQKTLKEAVDSAGVIAKFVFNEVVLEEETVGTIHGFESRSVRGLGLYEGQPAEFDFTFFSPKKGVVCVAFLAHSPYAEKEILEAIQIIFQ